MIRKSTGLLASVLCFSLLTVGCNYQGAMDEDRGGNGIRNDRNIGVNRVRDNYGVGNNYFTDVRDGLLNGNGADDRIGYNGYSQWGDGTPKYGLVRVNRSQLNEYANNPLKLDRTYLANVVTQSISQLSGINHATVLVTDDHVYVGCDADRATEEMVRKAASSVVPGYYKVYVSRNSDLTNRIMNLTKTNMHNLDEELDRILGNK